MFFYPLSLELARAAACSLRRSPGVAAVGHRIAGCLRGYRHPRQCSARRPPARYASSPAKPPVHPRARCPDLVDHLLDLVRSDACYLSVPPSASPAFEANTGLRYLIKSDRLPNARQLFDGMPNRNKALLEQKNGLAWLIFSKAGVDNTRLLEATDKFIQRQPKVLCLLNTAQRG